MATTTELAENEMEATTLPIVDSKYRLIILAAKRSKPNIDPSQREMLIDGKSVSCEAFQETE